MLNFISFSKSKFTDIKSFISLLFLDMAFSLPFAVKNGQVFVQCVIDPTTNKLNWMYSRPDKSLSSVLPTCNYLCEKDPIDNPSLYNRTWEKGTITVGTSAKYTCLGKIKYQF